jgi:hypothetical protein
MNPIHLNNKSASINILINFCLIFLMVYVIKSNTNTCPNLNNVTIKKIINDKDTIQYIPKGDWVLNTYFYNVVNDNILCGIIKNEYSSIHNNHVEYNNDCIIFTKDDIITTDNGKFKTINFIKY